MQGAERRTHRRLLRRVGVATAGLLVVAGTTTVFDASSLVLGSAPPTETLSCNDSWTGSSPSGVWNSAANWTAGVPNGASVELIAAPLEDPEPGTVILARLGGDPFRPEEVIVLRGMARILGMTMTTMS